MNPLWQHRKTQGMLWILGACLWASFLHHRLFSAEENPTSRFHLQSTMVDEVQRTAVINGQSVSLGDCFSLSDSTYKVVKIEPHHVLLKTGMQWIELEFNSHRSFRKQEIQSSPLLTSRR